MKLFDFLRKSKGKTEQRHNPEHAPASSEPKKEEWEESDKVEGIYDVHRRQMISPYSDFQTIKTAEGVVTAVEKGRSYFASVGSYLSASAQVKRKTAYITIQNERGSDKIEFPEDYLLNFDSVIVGSKVRYTNRDSSFDEGPLGYVSSDNHSLEFLDGPLKGKKLEERVTH